MIKHCTPCNGEDSPININDAQKELQEYSKELEAQLLAMNSELQTKYGEFQANEALMTDVIKEAKIKEIQDLELRFNQFQQSSNESLQQKQQEVVTPLMTKAQNAINEVAKESGYTYIFDISLGSFAYVEESRDIMHLVKSKLGIK